jgi:hypothetical protein
LGARWLKFDHDSAKYERHGGMVVDSEPLKSALLLVAVAVTQPVRLLIGPAKPRWNFVFALATGPVADGEAQESGDWARPDFSEPPNVGGHDSPLGREVEIVML